MIENFIKYSNIEVKGMYLVVLITIIIYFTLKWINGRYLISIYNIGTLIFLLNIVVISPLMYNDEAWRVMGFNSSIFFIEYLNKNYLLNLIGCFIFLIFIIIFEFKKGNGIVINGIRSGKKYLNEDIATSMMYLSIFIYFLLLLKVRTIPLFGNRSVFNNFPSIRPISTGVIYIITIFNAYFGLKAIRNKQRSDIRKYIISLTVMMLTGNRGPLAMSLVLLAIFYIDFNKIKTLKKILMIIIVALLMIGLLSVLSNIRNGNNASINMKSIVDDFLYGNTFSDMRDGAFILYGLESKDMPLIYGKTYLAGLISFLPSSISQFRTTWSYGRFTTETLFGWEGHYGLRGGWFIESYFNFGYIGVISCAIILAYVFGKVERSYRFEKLRGFNEIESKYVVSQIFLVIANLFLTSSEFYNFYVMSAVLCGCIILRNINIKFKIIK